MAEDCRLDKLDEMFSKMMKNPPEMFLNSEECKVCGEIRSQDMVSIGLGFARFMYYPCRHSSVHKNHVSTWYDENDKKVDV